MMLRKKKVVFWIRFILTTIFFSVTSLIIHFRVDFQPNTVSIHADIPEGFSAPYLRFSNTEATYLLGKPLPTALTNFSNLQLVFPRQTLLNSEQFLLIAREATNDIVNTTWTTAFPVGSLIPLETDGLLITSPCQEAQYSLKVGYNEWPVLWSDDNKNLLIAKAPGYPLNGSDHILVSITQPVKDVTEDIRLSEPCFESMSVFMADSPVRIREINVTKTFGKLGVTLPIATWVADKVQSIFSSNDPEINAEIKDGELLLYPGVSIEPYLIIQGNHNELNLEFKAVSAKYKLALMLMSLGSAVIFYLGLSLMMKLLRIHSTPIRQSIKGFVEPFLHGDQNLLKGPSLTIKRRYLFPLLLIFIVLCSAFFELQYRRFGMISLLIIGFTGVFSVIANKILLEHPMINWLNRTLGKITTNHLLVVLLLLGFGTLNLFWGLGTDSFYEDEFQIVDAAFGFLETGDYYRWDWANNDITTFDSQNSYAARYYPRSWPFIFLVAQSFRFFGVSEWSARFVSAISGLLFFVVLYLFTRYFTNPHISILCLFAAVFSPALLSIFRYTRMYALLLPLFLILGYTIYRAITGDAWIRSGLKKWDRFVGDYLNFDYRFAILSLPILLIIYIIHLNSMVILLPVLAFAYLMALTEKKKKYIVLSFIGTAIAVIVVPLLYYLHKSETPNLAGRIISDIVPFLSSFGHRNYSYFTVLLKYPFGVFAGAVLFAVFLYFVCFFRKSTPLWSKYLYLAVISCVTTLFYIFFAERYFHSIYVSHIFSFFLITMNTGLWYLSHLFTRRKVMLMLFYALMILTYFITVPSILLEGQTQFGDYRTAYKTIVDNYDHEKEVIFGQYLRTYYLQDLDGVEQISLLKNQRYSFTDFIQDLRQNPSGWLTWETRKSYHVDEQIIQFAEQYFLKLHGVGKDNTDVEVYYFSLPESFVNYADN